MTCYPNREGLTEMELLGHIQSKMKNIRDATLRPPAEKTQLEVFEVPTESNGAYYSMPLGFLGTQGCSWCRMGGCTMCDYGGYDGYVPVSTLLRQASHVLDRWYGVSQIHLSPLGSFFDEKELKRIARQEIFLDIARRPYIETLSVESCAKHVTKEKIKEAEQSLGERKHLEVGMGLESCDDFVRNICINKNLSLSDFKFAAGIIHDSDFDVVAHLLFKPPFLEEAEAIQDACDTIEFLNSLDVDRIILMACNVKPGTLVNELYENDLYHSPWLRSIVETVLNVSESARNKLYLRGFKSTAQIISMAGNCGQCDRDFFEAINEFNRSGNIDKLQEIQQHCNCEQEWRSYIVQPLSQPLQQRIQEKLFQVISN